MGSLILRALDDEHPGPALARLHPSSWTTTS
jgi:hypothetical protein